MPSSFMVDLIYFCENSGLGLTYGKTLFKGPKAAIPTGPGPFVSLIRAPGDGSEGTHNSTDEPAYERPKAQVLARATNYDDAERMAQALYDVMWPVQNQFINGTWWRELNVLGEIYDLPPDDKDRARIAFNIGSVKRTSPASS